MQHTGHPQVPYYNPNIPQFPNQQPYFYSQSLASTSQRPTTPYGAHPLPASFPAFPNAQQQVAASASSAPISKPLNNPEGPKPRKPATRKSYFDDKQIKALDDPKVKEHMKKSLATLLDDDTPGARMDEDAAELLLHMANDILNEITNFSFRIAEHRLQDQQGDEKQHVVTVEDMLLCLRRLGIQIPATETRRPRPQVRREATDSQPGYGTPGGLESSRLSHDPSTPPLAQTRPRRHTNPIPQEASEDDDDLSEEDDDDDDDSEEEEDNGNQEEEQESDNDRPRESKRLRARAEAAEKEKKRRGRGRGRPARR